jgi:CheY-like chemotaxis protein
MRYPRIMHVDDDDDDQEIFQTALQQVNPSVDYVPVNSALAALDQLLNKELEADLIFLDLNMPEMNGQQFLTEIRKHEQLRGIPVIVFSTSSHIPTIELVKELGARDFITKPANFKEMIQILKSILL